MPPPTAVDPRMTLIHHFVERSANLFTNKTAFIHGNVRATYNQINNQANNLALHLIENGIAPGDRVALLMENCLEYIISYYGILKTGAVVVPLNSDLKSEGLKEILIELEAKHIISSSRFEKLLQSTDLSACCIQKLILRAPKLKWSSAPYVVSDLDSLAENRQTRNPDILIQESDLASIIYTSGSTGRSKGVMLSHQNLVHNTFSICQYLHLTHNDIQMVVLPFYYVMGKSLLNTHFAVGGSIVINNKFAFPATVLNEMISEKVTGFSGVPSTFAYLLHRSPLANSRDKLSSLRYCSQAGGHMSRVIKEELRRVLPTHTEIYIMYGATEAAARLSYLEPLRLEDKMDSIGKAIPGVALRVLNEEGKEVRIGQVGELVAAGTNIMKGYWKNPKATAKVLVDGWYHTGDQAYQDEEGFFYLMGRKDDLLKVGGHRINPREVEDTLMESGMFIEAVVVGVPDELLGNKLVILAVPTNGECSKNKVLVYCANKLPKHKIPSDLKFTRALPKKTSGKIDRNSCRDLYEQLQPARNG
jgi:long-chain acyl-CoA synthetase